MNKKKKKNSQNDKDNILSLSESLGIVGQNLILDPNPDYNPVNLAKRTIYVIIQTICKRDIYKLRNCLKSEYQKNGGFTDNSMIFCFTLYKYGNSTSLERGALETILCQTNKRKENDGTIIDDGVFQLTRTLAKNMANAGIK